MDFRNTDHSIVSSDSNSSSIKYGDSDLSSKRRKMRLQHEEPHTDDYSYFSKSVLDDGIALNSTFSDDILLNSFNSNSDFKGGLLTTTVNNCGDTLSNQSLSLNDNKIFLKNCDKSAEKISFITRSPSGTSCGFENTFSILENQLKIKKDKDILSSCDVTVIDCINKTIPQKNNDYDEYHPSFFELELEAMQRAKEILEKYNTSQLPPQLVSSRLNISSSSSQNQEDISNNTITAPIGELLDDLPSIIGKNNSINNDDTEVGIDVCNDESSFKLFSSNQQQVEDYSQYVYHIAKGKDGRKYLKIVRNLLLDKVLCGNRVSQMTRAYNDIEAVTRLLEEKEKDLELTVQIGKELLTQNNRLESRITDLETELKSSNEDRSQLLHDLHKKNELIAVLTNYADDSSENETPTLSKSITLDLLQKKIVTLQDENKSLKMETTQLVIKTDEVEEQERKLMADITIQLNSTNNEFDHLNLELERQKEENRLQHEQIINLTSRLTEAEIRLHQLTTENDEQISLLSITKENQNLLTTELAEFKVRYQEVLSLLQEAQEQLRNYRKKQTPHARSSFLSSGMPPQPDSLHSELMESSLYSENSLDSGICTDRLGSALSGRMSIGGSGGIGNNIIGSNNINLQPYRKIFETVQCASKNGNYSDGMSQLGGMSMALSSSSGPRMSTGLNNPAGSYHRPSSVYSGSTYPSYDSSSLGIKTLSCESLQSQSDDNNCYPTQPNGVPGAPGAKDLEAALKRLTPSEVLVRRAMLSHGPIGTYSYDDQQNHHNKDILPFGIRTPDSIMSTGSSSRLSNMSALSSTERNQWRLPEKLQIIKPMEGSQTLHHWSRLATPTLSGLLEDRPGVKIRGGRGLEDLGLQVYSLSDVEEDVDDLPGKQYEAACVYTYTTSHVMHPDDGLTSDLSFLSQSQLSSRMASTSTSRQPSCPPTPRGGLSRRNSCSTFSVNMGLASMLNERGIKAVTPSALNTPAGPNFTPTVTPCNSPEGSPTRSMSPEPLFGILSTGADMIRRKLIGEYNRPLPQQRNNTPHNKQQKIMLSRLEKRALRSLRLLEKVESVGLENIIATQPNAMSQLVSGIASRSASPMAQLTSLKNLQTSCNNYVDDMHFNRNQIRSVLSKGLSNDSLKSSNFDGDNDFLINSFNSDDSSSSSELLSINYGHYGNVYGNSSSNDSQLQPLKASPKFYNTSSSSTTNNESSAFPKLKNYTKQNDESVLTNSNNTSVNNVPSTSTTNNETSDIRLKQMQRQKSRRNLKNGQRPDLGTVGGNGRVRSDLGKVDQNSVTAVTQQQQHNNYREDRSDAIAMVEAPEPVQSLTQSFVGSISSLFFGRKGGWL